MTVLVITVCTSVEVLQSKPGMWRVANETIWPGDQMSPYPKSAVGLFLLL